jgi:hypothetical protein
MGIDYCLYLSPWELLSPHPRPLMEEFPVGDRGMGPHCHPYMYLRIRLGKKAQARVR